MKLQIDIDKKTITPLEDVNIGDLLKALAKLFPEESFKEYTLLRGLKENELPWINPVVVPYPNPSPSLPWIQPYNQPYNPIGSNGMMWSYYNVEVTNVPRD